MEDKNNNFDETMEDYKNIRCSWNELYYGIYSKAIRDNNFKKCAEVGIGYGFHAKEILENTNLNHLYLIDPMIYYLNDGFTNDVIKFGGFDKLEKNIKTHLSSHNDRYTWFRQPSLTITNEQIPDESLDSVFIDGDHSYESVSNDLTFWWKKLRSNGWMLGDDYSTFPDVRRAVNEFAITNNLNIEFLSKSTIGGYFIYKFIKK
jgi:hypothetical protein